MLDKRWLAILSIAIVGITIDQVTTSYAVASNTASESNVFLQYIFITFPKPMHLLFYALSQATIVIWTIMLLWTRCPKNISYRQASIISAIVAMLPMTAGVNNLFVLLSQIYN